MNHYLNCTCLLRLNLHASLRAKVSVSSLAMILVTPSSSLLFSSDLLNNFGHHNHDFLYLICLLIVPVFILAPSMAICSSLTSIVRFFSRKFVKMTTMTLDGMDSTHLPLST